jgi:hypothetical protein
MGVDDVSWLVFGNKRPWKEGKHYEISFESDGSAEFREEHGGFFAKRSDQKYMQYIYIYIHMYVCM